MANPDTDDREAIFKIDGDTIDFLNQYKEKLEVESEKDVMMISLSILQWYMNVKDTLAIINENNEAIRVKLDFKA
jgi:hypothetical protein